MPRIRTIKPEFWRDEKLACLPAQDRLVFLGLIGMSDDFGRVHDNVKVIDAFVFPNSSETVRESLANLSRMNRIRRGNASNGMPVIEIVNWSKHQRVDKPQKHLALPAIVEKPKENKEIESIPESFANHSGTIPELVATLPGTRDQGSGTRDQGPGIRDRGSGIGEQLLLWDIPEKLDTVEVRELLDSFVAMRKRIRKPIKDIKSASLILKRFDDVDHLVFALETCIANDYQGLKPEYRPPGKINGGSVIKTFEKQKQENSREALQEWLENG